MEEIHCRDKKEKTPPWQPSFLGLSPDSEVTEQKKTMVYTIFLGKIGKRVFTIGPERRENTIEPQTPKKKKRRVSMVVANTFFFPALEKFQKFLVETETAPRTCRFLSPVVAERVLIFLNLQFGPL